MTEHTSLFISTQSENHKNDSTQSLNAVLPVDPSVLAREIVRPVIHNKGSIFSSSHTAVHPKELIQNRITCHSRHESNDDSCRDQFRDMLYLSSNAVTADFKHISYDDERIFGLWEHTMIRWALHTATHPIMRLSDLQTRHFQSLCSRFLIRRILRSWCLISADRKDLQCRYRLFIVKKKTALFSRALHGWDLRIMEKKESRQRCRLICLIRAFQQWNRVSKCYFRERQLLTKTRFWRAWRKLHQLYHTARVLNASACKKRYFSALRKHLMRMEKCAVYSARNRQKRVLQLWFSWIKQCKLIDRVLVIRKRYFWSQWCTNLVRERRVSCALGVAETRNRVRVMSKWKAYRANVRQLCLSSAFIASKCELREKANLFERWQLAHARLSTTKKRLVLLFFQKWHKTSALLQHMHVRIRFARLWKDKLLTTRCVTKWNAWRFNHSIKKQKRVQAIYFLMQKRWEVWNRFVRFHKQAKLQRKQHFLHNWKRANDIIRKTRLSIHESLRLRALQLRMQSWKRHTILHRARCNCTAFRLKSLARRALISWKRMSFESYLRRYFQAQRARMCLSLWRRTNAKRIAQKRRHVLSKAKHFVRWKRRISAEISQRTYRVRQMKYAIEKLKHLAHSSHQHIKAVSHNRLKSLFMRLSAWKSCVQRKRRAICLMTSVLAHVIALMGAQQFFARCKAQRLQTLRCAVQLWKRSTYETQCIEMRRKHCGYAIQRFNIVRCVGRWYAYRKWRIRLKSLYKCRCSERIKRIFTHWSLLCREKREICFLQAKTKELHENFLQRWLETRVKQQCQFWKSYNAFRRRIVAKKAWNAWVRYHKKCRSQKETIESVTLSFHGRFDQMLDIVRHWKFVHEKSIFKSWHHLVRSRKCTKIAVSHYETASMRHVLKDWTVLHIDSRLRRNAKILAANLRRQRSFHRWKLHVSLQIRIAFHCKRRIISQFFRRWTTIASRSKYCVQRVNAFRNRSQSALKLIYYHFWRGANAASRLQKRRADAANVLYYHSHLSSVIAAWKVFHGRTQRYRANAYKCQSHAIKRSAVRGLGAWSKRVKHAGRQKNLQIQIQHNIMFRTICIWVRSVKVFKSVRMRFCVLLKRMNMFISNSRLHKMRSALRITRKQINFGHRIRIARLKHVICIWGRLKRRNCALIHAQQVMQSAKLVSSVLKWKNSVDYARKLLEKQSKTRQLCRDRVITNAFVKWIEMRALSKAFYSIQIINSAIMLRRTLDTWKSVSDHKRCMRARIFRLRLRNDEMLLRHYITRWRHFMQRYKQILQRQGYIRVLLLRKLWKLWGIELFARKCGRTILKKRVMLSFRHLIMHAQKLHLISCGFAGRHIHVKLKLSAFSQWKFIYFKSVAASNAARLAVRRINQLRQKQLLAAWKWKTHDQQRYNRLHAYQTLLRQFSLQKKAFASICAFHKLQRIRKMRAQSANALYNKKLAGIMWGKWNEALQNAKERHQNLASIDFELKMFLRRRYIYLWHRNCALQRNVHGKRTILQQCKAQKAIKFWRCRSSIALKRQRASHSVSNLTRGRVFRRWWTRIRLCTAWWHWKVFCRQRQHQNKHIFLINNRLRTNLSLRAILAWNSRYLLCTKVREQYFRHFKRRYFQTPFQTWKFIAKKQRILFKLAENAEVLKKWRQSLKFCLFSDEIAWRQWRYVFQAKTFSRTKTLQRTLHSWEIIVRHRKFQRNQWEAHRMKNRLRSQEKAFVAWKLLVRSCLEWIRRLGHAQALRDSCSKVLLAYNLHILTSTWKHWTAVWAMNKQLSRTVQAFNRARVIRLVWNEWKQYCSHKAISRRQIQRATLLRLLRRGIYVWRDHHMSLIVNRAAARYLIQQWCIRRWRWRIRLIAFTERVQKNIRVCEVEERKRLWNRWRRFTLHRHWRVQIAGLLQKVRVRKLLRQRWKMHFERRQYQRMSLKRADTYFHCISYPRASRNCITRWHRRTRMRFCSRDIGRIFLRSVWIRWKSASDDRLASHFEESTRLLRCKNRIHRWAEIARDSHTCIAHCCLYKVENNILRQRRAVRKWRRSIVRISMARNVHAYYNERFIFAVMRSWRQETSSLRVSNAMELAVAASYSQHCLYKRSWGAWTPLIQRRRCRLEGILWGVQKLLTIFQNNIVLDMWHGLVANTRFNKAYASSRIATCRARFQRSIRNWKFFAKHRKKRDAFLQQRTKGISKHYFKHWKVYTEAWKHAEESLCPRQWSRIRSE